MKKLSIFKLILTAVSAILFFSCDNFFSGALIQEELQELIEEANAPEVDIYISPDANTGTATPSGIVTHKVGKSFPVIFTEAKGYQFLYWEVIDRETKETVENALEIKNSEESETRFTVKSNLSNICIHPVCVERPQISSYSPLLVEAGSPRDSSIIITFNKNISADFDFSKIEITSNGEDVKKYYKQPVLNSNVLTFAADKNNLIPVSGAARTVAVKIPADLFYESSSRKIVMGEDYSWSFKLNNTTNDKAEITFSTSSEYGTITPAGTGNYNIGESIKVKFEIKNGYTFKGWTIIDGSGLAVSDEVLKLDNPAATETNMTVVSAIKAISVTPNTILIPACTSVSPEESLVGVSVPQDTNIIINFNTPVKFSDFYDETTNSFKNIYISSDNSSLISGDTSDKVHYYFNKPVLSSDRKTLTIETNKENTMLTVPPKGGSASLTKTINVGISLSKIYADEVNSNFISDINWTYIINNSVDSQPPRMEEISFYKDQNLTQEITREDYKDDWDTGKLKNHHVAKLYAKVKGYDAGGGVRALCFSEKPLRDKSGADVSNSIAETPLKYVYTDVNNSRFKRLGNGYYEAVVPVQLSLENDGIVKLNFSLSDYADNKSSVVSFDVLKDTVFEQLDICPPEEKHEAGAYENSKFKDTQINSSYNPTTILKYRSIDNDFIRETNGNNDTVKFLVGDLKEKIDPYAGFTSEITVTDLLWGYSADEQSMNKASYDSAGKSYSFTRDKEKTTYIKFIAQDSAGNIKTLMRVIPKSLVIISGEKNTEIKINIFSAINSLMDFITSEKEDKNILLAKDFGYYTVFKHENDLNTSVPYKLATNTVTSTGYNQSAAFNSRLNGFGTLGSVVPFSYNPSEGKPSTSNKEYEKITIASKTVSGTTAQQRDFEDFRAPGKYYVYLVPYAQYDERIYFGALSNPIILNVSYDSVNNCNSCEVFKSAESNITAADLPENLIINASAGPLSSGLYNVNIQYPAGFVKNPSLQYFIKVNAKTKTGAVTYFNSDSFTLATENNTYYLNVVARSATGEEKTTSLDKTIQCTEDNIPPSFNSTGAMAFTNNYLKMFKQKKNSLSYYNPEDSSGLLKVNGKTEISYCFKKYGANQETITNYTYTDLLGEKKYKVSYDPDNFEYVEFPYIDYLEDGLYTLCLEVQDSNYNTRVYCVEASTLLPAPGNDFTIEYTDTDSLKFAMSLQNNAIQYYYLDRLAAENDKLQWKLIRGIYNYTSLGGNGGNLNTSVYKTTFTALGDSNGTSYVRVTGNYERENHIRQFPTKYILPDYIKNPANYPCKVKSYLYTDSGNNELIIFSDIDSPALVRTVYSNINLSTVSLTDKDEEIWSAKGTELRDSLKQDTGSFNYVIPDTIKDIPDGYWYTTLIHYANGDIKMTTPKRK